MLRERIRYRPLHDKIMSPEEAGRFVKDGTNLFISGFTGGYPKLIPRELARRAQEGEQLRINLYAGASTGDAVDGVLARAGVVNWRRPYMSDRVMRPLINDGTILFKDDHLSRLSAQV
jgi:acyl-CoA hydrolase